MRGNQSAKQRRIGWETSWRQGRREEPAQHTFWYVNRHRSVGRWIATDHDQADTALTALRVRNSGERLSRRINRVAGKERLVMGLVATVEAVLVVDLACRSAHTDSHGILICPALLIVCNDQALERGYKGLPFGLAEDAVGGRHGVIGSLLAAVGHEAPAPSEVAVRNGERVSDHADRARRGRGCRRSKAGSASITKRERYDVAGEDMPADGCVRNVVAPATAQNQ